MVLQSHLENRATAAPNQPLRDRRECHRPVKPATVANAPMPGVLGHRVIIGSILDGELRVLRDMPAPPSRKPPDVRAMRELVGKERFAELVTRGSRISYDEILDHILASLPAVELSDPA
jgi:hypothetical protein